MRLAKNSMSHRHAVLWPDKGRGIRIRSAHGFDKRADIIVMALAIMVKEQCFFFACSPQEPPD